ncbi:MAG: M12 family metallo-peptidase [Sterolibacterium sp.]
MTKVSCRQLLGKIATCSVLASLIASASAAPDLIVNGSFSMGGSIPATAFGKTVDWGGTQTVSLADAFMKDYGKCALNVTYGHYNKGDVATDAFTDRLYVDGKMTAQPNFQTLAAHDSAFINTQMLLLPGAHKLMLSLDDDNRVSESDEGNNQTAIIYNLRGDCGLRVTGGSAAPANAAFANALLPSRQAENAPPLFLPASGRVTANASGTSSARPRHRSVLQTRQVTIDHDLLNAATASLSLNLGGQTLIADLDRVTTTARGLAWIGHLRNIDMSQVVIVRNGDIVSGNISTPQARYHIRFASGGIHEIQEIDQSGFPVDETTVPIPAANRRKAAAAAPDQATPDDGTLIDVMVLYTATAREGVGGTAALQSLIDLAIAETNQSYQNSGILPRLRLVHAEEVAYNDASGSMDAALACVTGTADGCLDNIHALRDAYGADLVNLWIEGDGSTCGLAWQMADVSTSFAEHGFSVVDRSCATGSYSFGHELGHNMGARHDVYADNSVTPYPYAHGYVNFNAVQPWRTIMALNAACYAAGRRCTRIQYWANPALNYSGEALGDSTADTHLTLNNSAHAVANFRISIPPQPTASCSYNLSQTTQTADGSGLAGTQSVTSTPGCAWTATANATWITITSGASGNGSGMVTYTVATNNGTTARSGTLTIAGQTLTVTQSNQTATLATQTVNACPASGSTLAAGLYHSLALKSDGSLWAWGFNDYGQLGDGTQTRRNSPVSIGTGFSAIAAGYEHNLAIKSDGTLWSWGLNMAGGLGDGSRDDMTISLRLVGTGYSAIAAGAYHSVALKIDGSLWAWGYNDYGQCGDTTRTSSAIPVLIDSGFSAIAAGYYHTLAIKTDGALWAWGDNAFGQVGNGTTTNRLSPTQIGTGYSAIAAGAAHSLALKVDGSLWAWGYNGFGQLGDGSATDQHQPALIGTGYSAIAAGNLHSVGLKNDGTLWAWGNNTDGQLGDGSNTQRNTPVQIGEGFTSIAAGAYHTLAIKADGSLWAWGNNEYGQLGDGMVSAPRSSPAKIDTGYANSGLNVAVASGWNLLGNPNEASVNVASVFSDATRITAVWKWEKAGANWALYAPALADGGAAYAASKGHTFLTAIHGGEGYWVNAKQAFCSTVPIGTRVPAAAFQAGGNKAVLQGWHLLSLGEARTPAQLSTALGSGIASIWAWEPSSSKWYFYAPSLAAQGGTALADYVSSKGYLDFTASSKTLAPGAGVWVNRQ